MEYTFHSHNLELTEADSTLLDKKMERLEKHLKPPFTANVGLKRDAHHRSGDIITCTIKISHGKKTYHAERTAETIQDCLDEVIHAITQELERDRDKAKDNHDLT